jgi:arginine/lysine/ornithine decarboxylase
VIQSLHKTLPSFTQTAILHIGSQRVNLNQIQFFLDIFQTSSPSYIFLAGIQECIRFMDGEGREQLEKYWLQLVNVRKQLSNLKHINLLSMEETSLFNLDISKIVIGTGNTRWNARELYDKLLYEYHLQAEMCTENHVILMTTLNDSEEGLKRLVCALQEIDSWLSDYKFEPQKRETTKIQLKHCINKINIRYIYVYPPGIPILIPGERVTQESINTIKKYLDAGIKVHGLTKDGSILCQ